MCTFVWGNLVTWRCKKQTVVARSSSEAELRSLESGICEGMWLKRLLAELILDNKQPVQINCDNQSTLSIAKDPVQHDRTKHVEIDRHFINDNINQKLIVLKNVPSKLQAADILTKALPQASFKDMVNKLKLLNIYN